MATYLDLCQQTHRLIRGGNNVPGSQPTAVVGNSDPLLLDIVYFVNEAWQQIQQDHPSWTWMVKSGALILPLGTAQTLTLAQIQAQITDWQEWRPMMAGQYRYSLIFDSGVTGALFAAPTHMPMFFVPWNEFHGFFDRLPRTVGQPIRFSQDPQFNLVFDPPPAPAPSGPTHAYNMLTSYRTLPQVLSADGDVPAMPAMFHDLIVYWAGMLYAQTREKQALLSVCQSNLSRMLPKLRASQVPELVIDMRFC